ncbi:major capsid protein [Microvirus mar52]|uniref:Major capsid protein n=1 Tax=Microvirus mar52 TaxID=2851188 RepID=A0A8F5MJT5_9VIRU|nr:major capsid protein [Microvirus mar52]
MGVFGKNNGRSNRVKRNVFDLSMQNNLTTKFGQLTPVLCKEVLPGDSFRINTSFGLRFSPTYFPLQSRIRADIHYFYVRNRNLWKDWMDFIGNTRTGLVPPYRNAWVETGSLGDYLGVPTVKKSYGWSSTPFIKTVYSGTVFPTGACSSYKIIDSSFDVFRNDSFTTSVQNTATPLSLKKGDILLVNFPLSSSLEIDGGSRIRVSLGYSLRMALPNSCNIYPLQDLTGFSLYFCKGLISSLGHIDNALRLSLSLDNEGYYISDSLPNDFSLADYNSMYIGFPIAFDGNFYYADVTAGAGTSTPITFTLSYPTTSQAAAQDYADINLSALPFRAYESIYNSFYRDDRNNPRIVNGEPVYNEYLRNKEGGLDALDYPLMFRNWEQDFLTTAVPTPQQGNAPLVGISSLGEMTFSYDGKEYVAQAETAEDADTITSASFRENVPSAVARSLVDVVTSGISINDFRNVNAFQRWKETNLRRGMKYKDQIKSHFDVDVSYAELDMPEFIGGVSIPVTTNTVSATAETGTGPNDVTLGDYRGQLYGSGSSKHSVSHYFDEHGFVIGILSVVPVPVYSQLLPKFFLKSNPLDYFFPEFGHIGFQPISNNEVNMLAVTNKQDAGTFGYQRPWYDYLASVDEIHGDFRKNGYDDFVLSRTFDGVPNLGSDFTVIKPESLNHVFTYTGNNDKILGQIYFDIVAKRPIPLYGVPRLEADL